MVSFVKRIGIDFHVVDGIFQGSRSHVLELFLRVIRICPDIEFYLFLEKTDALREVSPDFLLPNVNLVCMGHANPVKRLCMQFPRVQKGFKLDLLHTQYVSPVPSFCKTVITLHDILFESYPQYFNSFFNIRSKLLMRISAFRSSHIFTVSKFSKNEIATRYGVSEKGITVIHNGVDQQKFYPGTDDAQVVVNSGLKSGEFILTVGRLEPRKNHMSLIKAYAQLDTKLPLVIIGQRHFGYQDIEKNISELGLTSRVLLLDAILDKDLSAYYRHAKIFVYPTWAEGFGMPVIEAMASGVPVITSNTTALPEVIGNAGLLIDPADVLGLRNAMATLLNDDLLAMEFTRKGLARADMFNWDASARKVKYVYEGILNG